MELFTKASLIEKLKEIRAKGWINSARHGNKGGVGNTLEDLLGIKENNLPMPNAAEWELKCQRVSAKGATALMTLFHCEPSPAPSNSCPSFCFRNTVGRRVEREK